MSNRDRDEILRIIARGQEVYSSRDGSGRMIQRADVPAAGKVSRRSLWMTIAAAVVLGVAATAIYFEM